METVARRSSPGNGRKSHLHSFLRFAIEGLSQSHRAVLQQRANPTKQVSYVSSSLRRTETPKAPATSKQIEANETGPSGSLMRSTPPIEEVFMTIRISPDFSSVIVVDDD